MSKVLDRAFTSAGSISGRATDIYFGKDGTRIMVLLGGGTKQRQQNDIKLAIARWEDFKRTKKLLRPKGE